MAGRWKDGSTDGKQLPICKTILVTSMLAIVANLNYNKQNQLIEYNFIIKITGKFHRWVILQDQIFVA